MKNELRLRHRAVSIVVLVSLLMCSFWAIGQQASSHRVTGNLVVHADTAKAIAKAVAEETYGPEVISGQMPLVAVRKDSIWHISGRLPPGVPGGVVEVWVSVRDGRVLRLTHGK